MEHQTRGLSQDYASETRVMGGAAPSEKLGSLDWVRATHLNGKTAGNTSDKVRSELAYILLSLEFPILRPLGQLSHCRFLQNPDPDWRFDMCARLGIAPRSIICGLA